MNAALSGELDQNGFAERRRIPVHSEPVVEILQRKFAILVVGEECAKEATE